MYVFFYKDRFVQRLKPSQQSDQSPPLVDRSPPKECSFPSTDPFDPALDNVIKKYPPLDCSNHTANIVYLDNNYVLRVNHSKLHLVLGDDQVFSHCLYKEIARQKGSDKKIDFVWTSESFNVSLQLPEWHESIVTECFDGNETAVSRTYFSLIRKRAEIERVLSKKYQSHIEKNAPLETMSVLMIGIDGMSKQHFERAMPKTRNFLLEKLGAIELYKYNKLAFETFPNVLALLTGHTPEEFYKGWLYNRTGYVDQINEAFLWSEARRIGYRTGLIMDCHSITAFHYQKLGFNVPPVHYYQRATVLASTFDKLMRGTDNNCIGDIPEVTQIHDYWLQMATTFGKDKTTPFFAYSFAARITHDDSDLAYQGDEAYHKFLQDLVATDSLDNTVIVWFSDHGPRFGPIRETYHGRIETSTPYIFFVFPPWFKRKYPQLISTLKINQNRLSSHFDVYDTIRDLLYLKNLPRKNGTRKERGISLFREIPRERTCDNAGIPGEFCACGRFSKPKMNATSLQVLGATLLRRVNSFIGFSSPEIHNTSKTLTVSDPSHSSSGQLATSDRIKPEDSENMKVSEIPASAGEFTSKCARLSLVRVESVYQVTNDQLQSLKEKSYRVTIRTAPGLALFEALINYEPGKSSHVVGDVVRINMYRGQADCVHDPWLRQFCFCV
ncbi:hypothetical protein PoB_005932700 [Plakobranchus ocellatus]|uniref:Sulfatase N-terminal domain-containing protein n=1 Tax=Plakobranchus ocellatus TaxID=259542 RepID=A0AAV4CMG5_9GAST|nr:hypothetical protein PoB_005932700 [Plakobranchus ocellatus]